MCTASFCTAPRTGLHDPVSAVALPTDGGSRNQLLSSPGMRFSDQPLPGDIVIRERLDTTTLRPNVVFELTHWPQDVAAGGPYQSLTYACEQARKLVMLSGARIWRRRVKSGIDSYEDLTDA
jgi:hypothetical protein